MITIEFIGLDQFVVGTISKDITGRLANICETSEDNINFYAPNNQIYHKGFEQTSWNGIIKVYAPCKFRPFQKNIAALLLEETIDYVINARVEFYYYEEEDSYERINPNYPHFLAEDNTVSVETEEVDEETEVYTGNVFEGFEEKLKEKSKK